MKDSIGYRIRKLREQKDYTQDNMGAELGITPGAYAKIERDETDPSASRLIQIAEILGVDVAYFFSTTNATVASEKSFKYGTASKEDIEELTSLINTLKKELEKLKKEVAAIKKTPAGRGAGTDGRR